MPTPIKRHVSIQPLSREHHQDLLLCWKIRTGFSKGIQVERIKKYADWFYESHMNDHFQAEEELEQHVRFEERVLFNQIQDVASEDQLRMIHELLRDDPFIDRS